MAENFDVMAILFYRLPLIENRIINKLKEPLNGYCSTDDDCSMNLEK